MAIDKINTIDLVGIDNKSGHIILTISDHLDWIDVNYHLQMLQEKINCYLRFIESGEIYETYPRAKGKKLIIEIVGKYEISIDGLKFIEKAKTIIQGIGVELKFRLFDNRKLN